MTPAPATEAADRGSGPQRASWAVAVLVLATTLPLAPGCNKGPTSTALAEADQALAAARPALERYLPEELARLDADGAAARARLAEGRYTDALRIAQELPERIAVAAASAEAKRSELAPAWTQLAGSVHLGLETLGARLAEIETTRRWPRAFGGAAALEGAKVELAAARDLWRRAEQAHQGDEAQAVRMAREAQGRLEALAARLTPAARSVAEDR